MAGPAGEQAVTVAGIVALLPLEPLLQETPVVQEGEHIGPRVRHGLEATMAKETATPDAVIGPVRSRWLSRNETVYPSHSGSILGAFRPESTFWL